MGILAGLDFDAAMPSVRKILHNPGPSTPPPYRCHRRRQFVRMARYRSVTRFHRVEAVRDISESSAGSERPDVEAVEERCDGIGFHVTRVAYTISIFA